nr:hypothetical protein [Pseudomonas sp.]
MSFTTDMQAPLSPELEERLNNFNTTKAAYIDAQERFLGITQGNLQLRQQADQLERMADTTDASWKKMAASCTVEQSEINAEIERAKKLRDEAQALRLTAAERSHLIDPWIVQLAELRLKLKNTPESINGEHWKSQLSQLLRQEGLRETLLQAFVLCRASFLSNLSGNSAILDRLPTTHERQDAIDKGIWKAFRKELEALFAGEAEGTTPQQLATMPPAVPGEVVVDSPVAMNKLRAARSA